MFIILKLYMKQLIRYPFEVELLLLFNYLLKHCKHSNNVALTKQLVGLFLNDLNCKVLNT